MIVRNTSATGHIVTLGLLSGLFLATAANAADRPQTPTLYGTDPATGIVITPRVVPTVKRLAAVQEESKTGVEQADTPAHEGLPIITPHPQHTSKYRTIFQSIPFSRAEFNANPSYRHDAAMELLTGRARPPKIQVNTPASAPAAKHDLPDLPVMRLRNDFDMTRGPYSQYQHLFGYEGGYRPQFYRY